MNNHPRATQSDQDRGRMMKTHCFGKFNKEQEECAYCKVAVECYESSDTSSHPRATQKNLAMEVTK